MGKHKNNADFRRRYSEKRGHYKRLFDLTMLGVAILVGVAASAANWSQTPLCGAASGGFAGWFLVVIGYLPLLLCALVRACFGSNAAIIPTEAWHLAAVDLIYLALLWGMVRWIARRHSSEFLRRAWHIALILFGWGAFQLAVFSASTLWERGNMRDAAASYLHQSAPRETNK